MPVSPPTDDRRYSLNGGAGGGGGGNMTSPRGPTAVERERDNEDKGLKEMRAETLFRRTVNFHDPKYQGSYRPLPTLTGLGELLFLCTTLTSVIVTPVLYISV